MQNLKFDLFHIVLVVAFAIAATLVYSSYRGQRDAQITLASTMQAQKAVLDAANEREQLRDAALLQTLNAITAQKQAVNTPQKAALAIPQQLAAALPQPITINVPTVLPGGVQQPAHAEIPIDDLKPLSDKLFDCEACNQKLASAELDKADDAFKIKAMQKQIDAAVQASHGSFWQRLKGNSKWFIIGSIGATAALCAAGHCKL